MIIVYISLGIAVTALVIAVVIGNKARKGIQGAIKEMSSSMEPVQADLNKISEQSNQLSANQQKIQEDFNRKSKDIKTSIKTAKEIPGLYKELFDTDKFQYNTNL
ncbi:DUF948 domain-containing protein [Sediminibacillus massiliensis]|uniref:DUF948 domain-containing protein n=1 Tax=Sediminibacillus massiliensis TaxID=1926277 RepID=UPI0015C2DEF9|nr:DUF948 domain-containing protein [Sediminibacillus massiliensis]